jgi:hypothetical protein
LAASDRSHCRPRRNSRHPPSLNLQHTTAAWTLRRRIYVVFVKVPFAGLTEMLERLRSPEGPIRYRTDRDLTFDLQPVVFPQGFELQVKSIALWDRGRTTRCVWLLQSDSDPKVMARHGTVNIVRKKPPADRKGRRDQFAADGVLVRSAEGSELMTKIGGERGSSRPCSTLCLPPGSYPPTACR